MDIYQWQCQQIALAGHGLATCIGAEFTNLFLDPLDQGLYDYKEIRLNNSQGDVNNDRGFFEIQLSLRKIEKDAMTVTYML